MKLRNKKTGKIIELNNIDAEEGPITSLAELNAEWEDYEEPSKTIWQIKDSGELQDFEEDDFSDGYIKSSKSIGNYFETKEEAEKAVEKLKAWKRLKDKGFRFKKWESYEETSGLSFTDRHIVNSYTAIFDFNRPCRKYEIEKEVKDALDLLFLGGEE